MKNIRLLKRYFEELVAQMPAMQKIRFYQAVYSHKRCEQAMRLLQISVGKQSERSSNHFFAEYKTKSVLDQESVLAKASGYDVISFDIFDTLLFRNVKRPTDVFRLLEQENRIPHFAQLRVSAEHKARQEKYISSGSDEITIHDIYQMAELKCMMPSQTMIANEIAKELECCYANPVMAALVERLSKANVSIIAVSDMYLTEPILTRLLQNCGFTKIEAVFASSEYGVSKNGGELFEVVKQKLGPNKRILHIGDNFHSDVLMCEKMNLDALHYCRDGTGGERDKGRVL